MERKGITADKTADVIRNQARDYRHGTSLLGCAEECPIKTDTVDSLRAVCLQGPKLHERKTDIWRHARPRAPSVEPMRLHGLAPFLANSPNGAPNSWLVIVCHTVPLTNRAFK